MGFPGRPLRWIEERENPHSNGSETRSLVQRYPEMVRIIPIDSATSRGRIAQTMTRDPVKIGWPSEYGCGEKRTLQCRGNSSSIQSNLRYLSNLFKKGEKVNGANPVFKGWETCILKPEDGTRCFSGKYKPFYDEIPASPYLPSDRLLVA